MKITMDRRRFLQLAGALAAAGALAGCGEKSTKQRVADSVGEALNSTMEGKLKSDSASVSVDSSAASEAAEPENHDEISAEDIYEGNMVGDTSSVYITAKKGDNRIELSTVWDDPEEVPYFLEELAAAYGASASGVHDHSWDAEVDFYLLLSSGSILRGETINGGEDGVRVWVPAGTKASCSVHAWSEDGASFDLDSPEFELTSDNVFDYTLGGGVEIEQE